MGIPDLGKQPSLSVPHDLGYPSSRSGHHRYTVAECIEDRASQTFILGGHNKYIENPIEGIWILQVALEYDIAQTHSRGFLLKITPQITITNEDKDHIIPLM